MVVAWFGTDLRAGVCEIKPAVESYEQDRARRGPGRSPASTARRAPGFDGRGPPGLRRHAVGRRACIDLIAELKARGLKVTLYPFVMMDMPAGNTLPDPLTGAASQPPYPWRGRITCDPAPGQPGTPDGTATAGDQIDAFFGDGDDDWRYRRMVLHYANLAASAGGVDAFLIGSELRGLTRVRSASGVYPAVNQLVALAADVKSILAPSTLVTYGADWTEYGAHVVDPSARRGALPARCAVGVAVDRRGRHRLLRAAVGLARRRQPSRSGVRELDSTTANYLKGNLARGEAFDWYYADDAARTAQTRTSITDGLGKPWVFRVKDLWSFWSNPHHERVGGVELASPTDWVPQSKPIWLTELGCAAVDKGANQPSTFPDPKSSESGVPYFSNGRRDDLIQRRHLESVLSAFDFDWGATSALNPVSTIYGGRMIDASSIYLWTWDARPYPAFPAALDVWSDGINWDTGHWLTGRLGGAPLDDLVAAILTDSGVTGFDASALGEGPDGYLVDRPMAPRAALEPLSKVYAFDAAEQSGVLTFRPRGGAPVAELAEDDLVLRDDASPFRLTRAQETELPREVSFGFSDSVRGSPPHGRGVAPAGRRRGAGRSCRSRRRVL